MATLRTDSRDIAPKVKPPMPVKIGAPPPGKLGIYTHDNKRIGHIGPLAGPGAVSRFTGHTNVALTEVDGRKAWKEIGPTSARGAADPRAAVNAKLEKSLRADRGSVRKS